MTIFVDSDYKCHTVFSDTYRSFDVPFFDGKCKDFIEGYRYIPIGEKWVREDGMAFDGETISAWKPYGELDEVQREYERAQLADMKAALELLGVSVDE